MVDKCKKCGYPQIKYPLWKGQEEGEPYSQDKLITKNLFKIDAMSLFFIVSIILMFIGFHYQIEEYKPIIQDPVKYSIENNLVDEQCVKSMMPINNDFIFQVNPNFKVGE